MPTIINQDGFRIIIYPDDHLPPHVHAIKNDEEAKITIGNEDVPPTLIEAWMNKKDTKKAMQIVMENQDTLLDAWREIHG